MAKKKITVEAQTKTFECNDLSELKECFAEIMDMNDDETSVTNIEVYTDAKGKHQVSCTSTKKKPVADKKKLADTDAEVGEESPGHNSDEDEDNN